MIPRAVRVLGVSACFCAVLLLLSSCATLSGMGVGRVRRYDVVSERLPKNFDGFKIAFISDTHYPSLFTKKRLSKLLRKLRSEEPDLFLLGGDYVTSARHYTELFDSLSSVETAHGIYAVPGNHDFKWSEACTEAMDASGVVALKDSAVYLSNNGEKIALVGVENPFAADSATVSLAADTFENYFTILLVHTPDYAQDIDTEADLVLAGHTHGGQVNLFGIYAPVTNSRYGMRFISGMNFTDSAVPVVTTNGVGTSRRRVRFCAPSEIVMITLRTGE